MPHVYAPHPPSPPPAPTHFSYLKLRFLGFVSQRLVTCKHEWFPAHQNMQANLCVFTVRREKKKLFWRGGGGGGGSGAEGHGVVAQEG